MNSHYRCASVETQMEGTPIPTNEPNHKPSLNPQQPAQLLLFDPGETNADRLSALVEQLFNDHLTDGMSGRPYRATTAAEYRVTMRRFSAWVRSHQGLITWVGAHRSATPMHMLSQLSRSDLDEFLDWVGSQTAGQNRGRVINKRREHLSAILSRLSDLPTTTGNLPKAPKRRPQLSRRQKVTMSVSEVGRLYECLRSIPVPPSWDENLGPWADYWQAALVFFCVLGVDTGTLWPSEAGDQSALRWRCWFRCESPPTRNTDTRNPHGWLVYARKKTSYPMQRPVNSVLAWQLHHLAGLAKRNPDDLIFPVWKRSRGWRPTEIFRRACEQAAIAPAIDGRSLAPVPWMLLHLRKTSATWHHSSTPGSGSAVLGHRSTELSAVTESHYVDCSPLAERAILTTPMPEEFPRLL